MKNIHSIQNLFRDQKGQSLVETAIVAPILIFMLIGVFEVGWALRGYLVLANVSRESTRFGVRPGYLNYTNAPPTGLTVDQQKEWAGANVGYVDLIDHISHLVIDTRKPCAYTANITENKDCDGDGLTTSSPTEESQTQDCDAFSDTNLGYIDDDLIRHPGMNGYENFFAYTYDPDPADAITYTTALSYEVETKKLAAENNKFNCELLKRTQGATPSPNYVLMTEMFYKQPQLFGFPIIANPFTDPVPMYGHTTMRMITSRSGNDIDKSGPACEAYPFIIRDITIGYPNPNAPQLNTKVDIFGGNGPSDFGWLGWNGIPTTMLDNGYLRRELITPRMALSDFYDARDPSDRNLSVGDWVASLSGDQAAVNTPGGGNLVTELMKLERFRIPVWDQFNAGSPNAYHIVGFIWVKIELVTDINLPGKVVLARYLGDASEGCTMGN
jgi:hypothetical protein